MQGGREEDRRRRCREGERETGGGEAGRERGRQEEERQGGRAGESRRRGREGERERGGGEAGREKEEGRTGGWYLTAGAVIVRERADREARELLNPKP